MKLLALLASCYLFLIAPAAALDGLQATKVFDPLGVQSSHFGSAASSAGGPAVALAGDVLVVGAPLDKVGAVVQGSATVFRWNGSSWAREQQLTSVNGAPHDRFGGAVATDGTFIVVGAFSDDITAVHQGSATVFAWDATLDRFVEVQEITTDQPSLNSNFGTSVAIDGNTLVVGSPGETVDSMDDAGAVKVFSWDGSAWLLEETLSPSTAAPFSYFGASVGISGDFIVASRWQDDIGQNGNQGSATVFRKVNGVWSEEQTLVDPDGEADDTFGHSLSIHGNLIVAGVPGRGPLNQGGASVFRWNGSEWTLEAKLEDGSVAPQDFLGRAVAVHGDRIALGAPRAYVDPAHLTGYMTLFANDGQQWREVDRHTPQDALGNDHFGHGLVMDSSRLVATSPFHDVGINQNQGVAYVFDLPSLVPSFEHVRAGTPANPLALSPGVSGSAVLCQTWDPAIDHAAFVSDSIVDLLVLSTETANVPLPPHGTLLCGTAFLYQLRQPGVPFSIPIPEDPTLLGVGLCAAGASVDPRGLLHLTNALDVQLGNF